MRLPSIPSIPNSKSLNRAALSAIKQVLDIRNGDSDERYITYSEYQTLAAAATSDFDADDYVLHEATTDAPDPPSNFVIARSTFISVLTWDYPVDDNDISHIEVLYYTSDDFSSANTLAIVTNPEDRYVHQLNDLSTDYYYWIRCVDYSGNYSTYLPVSGGYLVEGATSVDETISDIMTLLTVGGSSEPSELPFVSGNIDGTPAVGLNGNLIIDGSIIARNIQARTITANKIASGTITANEIQVQAITANEIETNTITLNRLNPEAGSVTFTSGNMTFANGADLILQSNEDDTAILTLHSTQSGGRFYDMLLNSSGTAMGIIPRVVGGAFTIGGSGSPNFETALMNADSLVALQCFGTGSDGSSIQLHPTGVVILADLNGSFTFLEDRLATSSTAHLGDDSTGRWGTIYGTAINTTGTSTMDTILPETVASNLGSSGSEWGTLFSDSVECTQQSSMHNILPYYGSSNLGSGGSRWDTIYADELNVSETSTMDTINPENTLSSTLGSAGNKWYQVWCGNIACNSIYTTSGQVIGTSGTPYDYIYANYVVGATGMCINRTTPSSTRRLLIEETYDSGDYYPILVWDYTGPRHVFSVQCSGTVYSYNNNYIGSDKKFKDNIVDVDWHLIPKLLNLKVKNYNLKDSGENHYGVIAQEAEDIFPDLVKCMQLEEDPDENGTYAFSYTGLIPYLLKGHQEQQDYIDALSSRLETLEAAQAVKVKQTIKEI